MTTSPPLPTGTAGTPSASVVSVQGVSGGAPVKTDNSAVTQPVSATALPLPAGAATAANQTTELASLASIATNTSGVATAANQTTQETTLSAIATNTTGLATATAQTTGNTSLAAIATATAAAATATAQATGNTSLAAIATSTAAAATAANQATELVSLATIATNTGRIPAQGQALAAGSTPVVLPAAQITALTPPTTMTVAQPTAANLNVTSIGGHLELAGLSAGSLSADLVPSTDVSSYVEASLQILGTFTGTLAFQGSNDNTNWFGLNGLVIAPSINSNSTQGNTGLPGTYIIPLAVRYLRVRMVAYTSGTATGTCEIFPTATIQYNPQVTAFLGSGSNIIGKVSTDTSTHGITDLVAADITKVGGAALAIGQKIAASSLPVVLASDQVVGTHTNATRNAGVTHRSAVTVIDKLASVGTITLTGQTGGSLVSATTYYVSAAAYNKYGNTIPATVVSAAPGSTNTALRAAFAQVTGAVGYDVFLSVDAAAPKWVGRITEAQRASGILITAVGTTGAGGAAGSVDIQVPGTGLQTTVSPFLVNNAYTPESLTAVNCAGYSVAHIKTALAVTDLRSLPALSIVPFLNNQIDGFYDQAQIVSETILVTNGACLRQDYVLNVDGSTGMVVCIDAVSGFGAAVTITVELS